MFTDHPAKLEQTRNQFLIKQLVMSCVNLTFTKYTNIFLFSVTNNLVFNQWFNQVARMGDF